MILIPEIKTERLLLRAPREDDFEKMKEYLILDRAKFIGGPYDEISTWNELLKNLGHWHLKGYGFWHIEHLDRICMVGSVGFLHHFDWPEPELCWNVHHDFEGQGLAFEAASAVRTYSANKLNLKTVVSYIDPVNTRSVRLAKRLGAKLEDKVKLRGKYYDAYRHPISNNIEN